MTAPFHRSWLSDTLRSTPSTTTREVPGRWLWMAMPTPAPIAPHTRAGIHVPLPMGLFHDGFWMVAQPCCARTRTASATVQRRTLRPFLLRSNAIPPLAGSMRPVASADVRGAARRPAPRRGSCLATRPHHSPHKTRSCMLPGPSASSPTAKSPMAKRPRHAAPARAAPSRGRFLDTGLLLSDPSVRSSMRYECPKCGERFTARPPDGCCPRCGSEVRQEPESGDSGPQTDVTVPGERSRKR